MEVRFNGLAYPNISSLVDLMVKTPDERRPHIEEYKTGKSPTYTPAQSMVFPQIMYGHSESFDPKIKEFGLPIGKRLPPLDIYQIWAKTAGQSFNVDQLRPEIVDGWPNKNPTQTPQRR